MSKGFRTTEIPLLALKAVEDASHEWEEMADDWLWTAPEYLVTVAIARRLRKAIDRTKRTLLLESHVGGVVRNAGGLQPGPKAVKLRSNGRFDIVLGHRNGVPRTVIEVKNPLWNPLDVAARKDLDRLCSALLSGKGTTKLHSGLLVAYTATGEPKAKDQSAVRRLRRKWIEEWESELKTWSWAGKNAKRYAGALGVRVFVRIHKGRPPYDGDAWAAVCVEVTRKPPSRR